MRAASAEPLWRLEGAQARQGSTRWPAEPLTLEIPEGRVAVLGASGAGKTSLLNLLAGFTQAERGSVRAPDRIAWVPQDHGLWLAHTAAEHLALAGEDEAGTQKLLADFDLAHRASARAGTLSIGEGARLAVARALAQRASAIVMDEPLAHVDAARAGKYWEAVRERVRACHASLIFATHQPDLALAEAEHAICLREGAVVFQGAVANLYHRPASPELANFLGPANWFTPADAQLWLNEAGAAPQCVRPERLQLTPDPGGATVVACRFLGSHAETLVRHPQGELQQFVHRPASALPIGAQVRLELLPLA